jgi:hypothetical protein
MKGFRVTTAQLLALVEIRDRDRCARHHNAEVLNQLLVLRFIDRGPLVPDPTKDTIDGAGLLPTYVLTEVGKHVCAVAYAFDKAKKAGLIP